MEGNVQSGSHAQKRPKARHESSHRGGDRATSQGRTGRRGTATRSGPWSGLTTGGQGAAHRGAGRAPRRTVRGLAAAAVLTLAAMAYVSSVDAATSLRPAHPSSATPAAVASEVSAIPAPVLPQAP